VTTITDPSQLPSWYEGLEESLPASLSDFHGPANGEVDLPIHVAWSGNTHFDVSRDSSRHAMYHIVIVQGGGDDVAEYLHPTHVLNDWGTLCLRFGRGYSRAWESRYPELADVGRHARAQAHDRLRAARQAHLSR
jgi:hypothetical protein